MRRAIVFATDVLHPLVELAGLAESSGFDRVWTTEYPGRDGIARALLIATATDRIGVGSGVAYAFTRPPLAMAALAADVHRISTGRFSLGISAGTRGVRRRYGADFDPPATRMVEYVERLRELWTDTGTYPISPPVFLPAFHSIMTRRAAAVADGLLLHPLAAIETDLRERVLPAVERGSADRSAPIELVAWRMTSIDDDEATARARAAAQIAFYLSTPSYAVAVEGTRWEQVPTQIRAAIADADGPPDWSLLGRGVPDSLIDELAVTGRADDVARRFDELAATLAPLGVTEIVAQTVSAGLEDEVVEEDSVRIIRTLGTLQEGRAR